MNIVTGQDVRMDATLRECRMVFERLMHVARINAGLVPSLRDAALFSIALGLSSFDTLLDEIATLERADERGVSFAGEGARPLFDANGAHAWMIAEAVTDLVVERIRLCKDATIVVRNTSATEQLAVVRGFAARFGYGAIVTPYGNGDVVITLHQGAEEDVLQRVRDRGLPVQSKIWWMLFHRANDALVPDSFDSRRHAGPVVVEADGRVVGREDEDPTDLTLLGVQKSEATA